MPSAKPAAKPASLLAITAKHSLRTASRNVVESLNSFSAYFSITPKRRLRSSNCASCDFVAIPTLPPSKWGVLLANLAIPFMLECRLYYAALPLGPSSVRRSVVMGSGGVAGRGARAHTPDNEADQHRRQERGQEEDAMYGVV